MEVTKNASPLAQAAHLLQLEIELKDDPARDEKLVDAARRLQSQKRNT